ncbi:MAG TPA: aspartyl protease family protein [Pelobium sp.]|nr:aspartyl protease family protein [Pelobium sp.]
MFYKLKYKQVFSILFVILTFTMPIYGQQGFVFAGKRTKEILAFKKSRGLIILPMYINGSGPFNFILDTGVGSLIITDPKLKDSLNFQYLRKIEIDGLGKNEKLVAYSTPFLKLKIGQAVFNNAHAAILASDDFSLSGYFGMPIHGLLGFDFFNSFIVKINYQAGFLKVFTREKRRLFKKGAKIPLLIIDKKPFISASVVTQQGNKLPLRLLIDSGSGHPLSLESFENKPFDLPNNFISANLGVGLNGNIRGFQGRVKRLNIARFYLDDVLSSFPYFEDVGAKTKPNTRNGSVGNPLLSKFSIVFDYRKSHVFFKPLNNFKKPFSFDKSGVEITTVGKNFDRYLISRVEPESAADEFGILVGDELLSINFNKASSLGIRAILEILSSETGRTLFIELARGDQRIVGILTLKKRI